MILIFEFRISKDRLEVSAIADFCGSDDNNFHNLLFINRFRYITCIFLLSLPVWEPKITIFVVRVMKMILLNTPAVKQLIFISLTVGLIIIH